MQENKGNEGVLLRKIVPKENAKEVSENGEKESVQVEKIVRDVKVIDNSNNMEDNIVNNKLESDYLKGDEVIDASLEKSERKKNTDW